MSADMLEEARNDLLAAASYLTGRPSLGPARLERSALTFFPLIGIAVGLVGACALLIATLFLPQPVPLIIALSAMALLTSARSETGLAAYFDGSDTDQSIGGAGASALFLLFALKLTTLSTIDVTAAMATLTAGQAISRFAHAACIERQGLVVTPASPQGRLRRAGLGAALAFLPCFLLFSPLTALYGFGMCLIGAVAFMLWNVFAGEAVPARRGWAVEQVVETAYLLGIAAAVSGPG